MRIHGLKTVVVCGLAASVLAAFPALGQSGAADKADAAGGTATLRVIVPWTHFAPSVAPVGASVGVADSPPAPQTSGAEIISPRLGTADLPVANGAGEQAQQPATTPATTSPDAAGAGQTAGQTSAQAPAQAPTPAAAQENSQPLLEEDISKKHPHPPEPVQLPPGEQIAAPLSDSQEPAPPAGTQTSPQSQTEASGAKNGTPATKPTPEARIASLSAGYQSRERDREDRLKSLESAGSGPTVERQETKLALEAESDRMNTAQQLAEQFGILASTIDARADAVGKLAADRKETSLSQQAGINQINGLLPRRELALRNLAALPAGGENDRLMNELQAEISHDETERKSQTGSVQEANEEVQALEAESARLSQAAAQARQRSAAYAALAENAQAAQDRLANRMEYELARERSEAVIAGASKVINASPGLSDLAVSSAPAAPAAPQSASGQPQPATGNLRECLRKTGNVDACLARQGVQ